MKVAIYALTTLALIVGVANVRSAAQTYTELYNFGIHHDDPIHPTNPGTLAQGRDGNLYSTAPSGGALGYGGIFVFSPQGARLGIYSFDSTHGANPRGGLTLGTDGTFYGAASSGGFYGHGTIFRITAMGILTVLHDFAGGADGGDPWASPIQAANGEFYGTTLLGYGTLYEMSPTGQLTTLHTFSGADGGMPAAPLVQGIDRSLYGTTQVGGTNDEGTVFRITPAGTFKLLYSFDGAHGAEPPSPLVQGTDGGLYGTTSEGGSGNSGVVFRITPSGDLVVLHDFYRYANGSDATPGLVLATDGNGYGATYAGGSGDQGVIYEIDEKGQFSVLYEFEPLLGGASVTLVQHTNGVLYGDTYFGRVGQDDGSFYSFDLGLAPFVRLVSTSGKMGQTGGILGQSLTGTTNVSFNGIPASFTVVSDTFITATVPQGATTGYVKVATPSGTLTSNVPFRVLQ